jgi:mannose-1-phosphate guanylyltransferase
LYHDLRLQYNLKITCSIEDEPLGTAGPIRLAKDIIMKDNSSGLFFVFNSDVICDYPLDKFVEFHKSHGKEGTLLVTTVDDPSKYGVVIANEEGLIQKFVEKPEVFVSNKINAGLYLFNVSMIDRIEARPTSIEREIFPIMAAEGQLYQMLLDGYWMDIGQPKDYLSGQGLFLKSQREKGGDLLASGPNIIGNVWIHASAVVDPTAVLGPNVVIAANCTVGPGCKIYDTTVLS